MNACDYTLLGLCLTRAPADDGFAIFGFSEFLAALALLVLVFNSSDYRYQFRVFTAPIPLVWLSFCAAVVTGTGTLLTDLWFAEQWYSLPWGVSRAAIQGVFGVLFLSTVLLWIWFAHMRPPVFSRRNYKRFYGALYRAVVRGSDTQLAILAGELVRSAEPLVRLSRPRRQGNENVVSPTVSEYAHDSLMLLANRKLCRHVISSAPMTAIALMEEAARQERYTVPLGGFARIITTEALLNRDSILYHEDTYGADVLGWVQPFSNAIYGNYRLVEGIAGPMDSPLDIDWRVAWEMDGGQFEAYCRITLLTFKSYIETGLYHGHSYALYRALGVIKEAGRELYKLDNQPTDATDREPAKRLEAAVHFISEVITFLGKQENLDVGILRAARKGHPGYRGNIFDYIAEAMFDLVLAASAVRSPPDNAWWIQHNTVWGRLFSFNQPTKAWNAIRFKFSRLVFDEIKRLEELPNFKGSRVLAICLNVMGLTLPAREQRDRGDRALHRVVLSWTRKNYIKLAEVHPPVAENCLTGSITFEPEKRRLVKTFSQGLRLAPSQEFLDLGPAPRTKGRSSRTRRRQPGS